MSDIDEKARSEKDVEKSFPPEVHDVDAENGSIVTREILKHANDADEALAVINGLDGQSLQLDEATNKRLLRRIDWNLIPIMCVVYGLNFLDKTTLSYASVMGIKEDLGLVGDDYQWLGSMFYFGYLAWEYPTNRLLQRLPLGKYSAFNIILWGTTLACFAAVNNFAGAIAVRFFLGLFEAAVTPGFALFTSQYYTKHEQGLRTGIWFSFNGWAQIFGGFVAYGIAVGVREHGAAIAGWKIVFLVTGVLTACIGVIFLFVVPDNPSKARWLSKEDRILALVRIRINQQGVGNKHFKMYQLREALLDPMSWLFFFFALVADIPNGGTTNFFSQLIKSFGYTSEQSLLYGTPVGAMEVVTLLACGYLGDKFRNRIIVGSAGLFLSIIGMAMVVGLPLDQSRSRLGGYYLTGASATPFVALLSLISSNVAGYTKKTTIAAMYLIGYCVGNIIGPQTFRPQDAPRFLSAEVTILVCWSACVGILAVMYFLFRYRNAQKAKVRAEPGYVKLENQEWLDLTDKENPEFVYEL